LRRDIRFALIDVVGAVKDSGKIAVRGGQNFGNIIDVEVTKVAAWNRKAKRRSDAQSLRKSRRDTATILNLHVLPWMKAVLPVRGSYYRKIKSESSQLLPHGLSI